MKFEFWNEGDKSPRLVVDAPDPSRAEQSLLVTAWVKRWEHPRMRRIDVPEAAP